MVFPWYILCLLTWMSMPSHVLKQNGKKSIWPHDVVVYDGSITSTRTEESSAHASRYLPIPSSQMSCLSSIPTWHVYCMTLDDYPPVNVHWMTLVHVCHSLYDVITLLWWLYACVHRGIHYYSSLSLYNALNVTLQGMSQHISIYVNVN